MTVCFEKYTFGGIAMNNSYWLYSYGRAYNPQNWYYNPNYLINRIYYIAGGKAYYKKDTLLKKGYLYVFGSDADFRVSQDPADPVDHAYFDFISFHSYLKSEFHEIDLSVHDKLRHLTLAFSEDFSDSSCPQHIANAYFELISRELECILGTGECYSAVTENVLRIIHTAPLAGLSIREISKRLNLNENYMIRRFREDMNVSPYQYLELLKADTAIRQIRQGRKMQEIADLLGYSSVSSLSYFFKSVTGRNLSEFR